MEPGQYDRENLLLGVVPLDLVLASMEPGQCDRENRQRHLDTRPGRGASMEPGQCDRENQVRQARLLAEDMRRNGARSLRPGKQPTCFV